MRESERIREKAYEFCDAMRTLQLELRRRIFGKKWQTTKSTSRKMWNVKDAREKPERGESADDLWDLLRTAKWRNDLKSLELSRIQIYTLKQALKQLV